MTNDLQILLLTTGYLSLSHIAREKLLRALGMMVQVPDQSGKEGLQLRQALFSKPRRRGAEHSGHEHGGLAVGLKEDIRLVKEQHAFRAFRPLAVTQQNHDLHGHWRHEQRRPDLAVGVPDA